MSATASNKGKLIIRRKLGETVIIGDGDNEVTVTITAMNRSTVTLDFIADRDIKIDRSEKRAADNRGNY